jgi:hypothetical protein
VLGDEIHMGREMRTVATPGKFRVIGQKFPVPRRTGNFTQSIIITALKGPYSAEWSLKTGKI